MGDQTNSTMVFPFEKNFDDGFYHKWMMANWHKSLWYSAAYVVVIFGSKYFMDKREKFEIRFWLALWSGILAVFSILGAFRTVPEMIHVLSHYGLQYSVCNPSYLTEEPTSFWAFVFAISKVYELGDTVFIVLRKQQLIFLHWYHHITVLIYSWFSYSERTAPGRWFMVMNYSVHSLMYSYYALKAMRMPIPRVVNVCITALQLCQMIIGTVINIWTYQLKAEGHKCQQSYTNLHYSLLMYFSYFVLFALYFYDTYIRPNMRKKEHSKSKISSNGTAKKKYN